MIALLLDPGISVILINSLGYISIPYIADLHAYTILVFSRNAQTLNELVIYAYGGFLKFT